MKGKVLAAMFIIGLLLCLGNGVLADNPSGNNANSQPAFSNGNKDDDVFPVIDDPTEWVITTAYPDLSATWPTEAKQKLNPTQCSWLYEEMAKSLANLREPDFKGTTKADFNYCLVTTYRQHHEQILISLLIKRISFFSHGKTLLSIYNLSKEGWPVWVDCDCIGWYDSYPFWLKKGNAKRVLEINIEADKRGLKTFEKKRMGPAEELYPNKIVVISNTPPPSLKRRSPLLGISPR